MNPPRARPATLPPPPALHVRGVQAGGGVSRRPPLILAGERWFGPKDIAAFTISTGADLPGRSAVLPANLTAENKAGGLAMAFAAHLDDVRRHRVAGGGGVSGGRVCGGVRTSLTPPRQGPAEVRIPHLVTVTGPLTLLADKPGQDGIADVVVWEVMSRDRVPGWLGQPLPDQQFAEQHLPGLLAMKQTVRDLRLPTTAAAHELARLLTGGRYISIRLVYQHDALFRALLDRSAGRMSTPSAERCRRGSQCDKGAAVNPNAWTDATSESNADELGRDSLSISYARHTGTLRGAVRQGLVARALAVHLPAGPQRVLDVGGGTGHQAVALARAGHDVVVLDPDQEMLARAQADLLREPDEVVDRVQLVIGRGEDAASTVGGGFDVVCCHGVLMYLDDPGPLLRALVAAVRPRGIVSVLTKNAAAMAMRPGMEGRWADALDSLDVIDALHEANTQAVAARPVVAQRIGAVDGAGAGGAGGGARRVEQGRLGVPSRGDSLEAVQSTLWQAGSSTLAWYGVRVFTDHLGDAPVGADFDRILDLEWAAGARDPYRGVARLLHVIVSRDDDLTGTSAGTGQEAACAHTATGLGRP